MKVIFCFFSDLQISEVLMQLELPIRLLKDCQTFDRPTRRILNSRTQICAFENSDTKKIKDSCKVCFLIHRYNWTEEINELKLLIFFCFFYLKG